MKNPGAANFKSPNKAAITSSELLEHLRLFDDGELKAEWYEFNSDPTMKCIGNLFSEYYALRGEALEGVIQIFNLFYLREADLGKALCKAQESGMADMSDDDIEHLKAPVYLGFSDLAWHKTYCKVAEKFFIAAKKEGMLYLDNDFRKNSYTHPLYLMMYGKNRLKCIQAKYQFYQNTPSPIISQEILDRATQNHIKLNNYVIMEKLQEVVDEKYCLAPKEEKNHRYLFDSLELTISDKENGFVGFRHPVNGKKHYNYIEEEVPNEYLYRAILSEFGYDTEKTKEQTTWLGRKHFYEYGNKEQSVVDCILDELQQIHNRFSKNGLAL